MLLAAFSGRVDREQAEAIDLLLDRTDMSCDHGQSSASVKSIERSRISSASAVLRREGLPDAVHHRADLAELRGPR